jgi:hypothetical protein
MKKLLLIILIVTVFSKKKTEKKYLNCLKDCIADKKKGIALFDCPNTKAKCGKCLPQINGNCPEDCIFQVGVHTCYQKKLNNPSQKSQPQIVVNTKIIVNNDPTKTQPTIQKEMDFPKNSKIIEKVAFVIDTSGSMRSVINRDSTDTRLSVVKREMKIYIKNNPESSYVIISGDPLTTHPVFGGECLYSKDLDSLTNHIDSINSKSTDHFTLNIILDKLNICSDIQRIEIVTDGGILGIDQAKGSIKNKDAIVDFYLFSTGGNEDELTKQIYLERATEFYDSVKNSKSTYIKIAESSKKK